MNGGNCNDKNCGVSHEAELEAHLQEGWDSGDAPMAACCARELDEMRENNRVLGILKKADVSTQHLRKKEAAISTARPLPSVSTSMAQQDVIEDEDSDFGSDDGEVDAEFERYRAERMAQLKKESAQRVKLGAVASVDNNGLQKILKEQSWKGMGSGGSSVLVCQFSVKGDAFSHELDEVVDQLAARYAKLSFVRIQKTKGLVINQRDQVNQAALCCFEAGQHKSILFGEEIGAPEEVNERVIVRWLQALGVVAERRRQQNGSDEEYDDEEGEPCVVCGRCYPHEHIKTVQAKRSDSEDESDGDW
jgi:hypothetical protein